MPDLFCATCGKEFNGNTKQRCECGGRTWTTKRITKRGTIAERSARLTPGPQELLESFRARPSMYMGKKDIQSFAVFLAGVQCAEGSHDVGKSIFKLFRGREKNAQCIEQTHFEDWLERKYGHRSGRSFVLAREKAGDDEKALELWFQWYDEFQKAYPIG